MVTRINTGVSGLDIDSLVKQLMTAERAPLDKLKQQKQQLDWQRTDYRDMNTLLSGLRDAASKMRLQSTYLSKKATSSDDTSVTATGSPNAADGTYKLKIKSLATGASLTSDDVTATSATNPTGKGDLSAKMGVSTTLTITGDKGNATIKIDKDDSLATVIANINAKTNATGVRLNYDVNVDRLMFVSTNTGKDAKIQITSTDSTFLTSKMKLNTAATASEKAQTIIGSQTFSITSKDKEGNDVTTITSDAFVNSKLEAEQKLTVKYGTDSYDFTVTNRTTLRQLMDQVNSSALGKLGVSFTMDDNGKINIFNPDQTKTVSFEDGTSDDVDIVSNLGLKSSSVTVKGDITYTKVAGQAGKDAEVTYNGIDTTFSNNTFSLDGITFRALKADPAKELSVTITQDVDTVFDAIKSFIDKYNEAIEKIDTKTTEKKYRDFLPLTEDQRKAMSDDDIKLWEEKAKSGMLRGDMVLTSALSNMRSDFYNTVSGLGSGQINQLTQIGIQTGDYTERGKLTIKDEDALRSAIASNPDQVMRLFTQDDTTAKMSSGDGIARRIYDRLDDVMKTITKKAGSAKDLADDSTLTKSMADLDSRIYDMTQLMTDKENAYYKKFSAMETALSKLNAQSSSLLQALTQNQSN
ncbi:flagellar filament capping protein FliD [Brevibacillus fluminis]|uniref:flagellar filament capping protein FliD n=1 Tax=Brevibacillus fluminis TaxID=511487 RepID=UPI003F894449